MYDKHFGFTDLPFNVTPDPRFLYNSALYQEAFAVLRYGVEARKGFIVITGETGTGKTMLLRMLMHSVASSVHTAFIFNPRVNFTELLRLILSDLEITHSSDDKPTMMRHLNDYLIEQCRRGDTVALLVDEAQDLSDEMLEELRLLSNLETRQEKLIQIVLMGQPELERKLEQPGLRQLKQRVALRCRLLPLRSEEVGLYIAARLQTAGYEGEGLFAPEAVEKIAHYSAGIPRLINVICDNALLIAYAASAGQVSAGMVEKVAVDLQFTTSHYVKKKPPAPACAITRGQREASSSRRGEDETTIELPDAGVAAFTDPVGARGRAISGPKVSAWPALRHLVGLVILVGTGVLFYSQQTRDYLAPLTANSEDSGGMLAKAFDQAKPPAAAEEVSDGLNHLQAPAPQDPASPTRHLNEDVALVRQTAKLDEAQALQTHERPAEKATPSNRGEPRGKITTATHSVIAIKVPGNRTLTSDKLSSQISKAISDRAIQGVEVSVINKTVNLAGRVATERQRAAAMRAARSVPGVKDIRDQIIVEWDVVPATPP
jgi:general secretion pathway protein A